MCGWVQSLQNEYTLPVSFPLFGPALVPSTYRQVLCNVKKRESTMEQKDEPMLPSDPAFELNPLALPSVLSLVALPGSEKRPSQCGKGRCVGYNVSNLTRNNRHPSRTWTAHTTVEVEIDSNRNKYCRDQLSE